MVIDTCRNELNDIRFLELLDESDELRPRMIYNSPSALGLAPMQPELPFRLLTTLGLILG